jgi:hypothetical protein
MQEQTIFKRGNVLCQRGILGRKRLFICLCDSYYTRKNLQKCWIFVINNSSIELLPIFDSTHYSMNVITQMK